MKKAIDNNGIEVEVSDDTPVDTTNGTYYLLTPERLAEEQLRESEWEANALQRLVTNCYEKRTSPLVGGGYGTTGEQLDMIYHQGIDAWKTHIEAVKEAYPKPE